MLTSDVAIAQIIRKRIFFGVAFLDYCIWWAAHRLQKPYRSEQPHQSGKAFLRSRFLSHSINHTASLCRLWTAGSKDRLQNTCTHVHTCTKTCMIWAASNLIGFFCFFFSEGKNIKHRENLQPPQKGEWNCGRLRSQSKWVLKGTVHSKMN